MINPCMTHLAAAQRQTLASNLLTQTQIPVRYLHTKTLNKHPQFSANRKQLFTYYAEWGKQPGNVVLMGAVGTGKTHLACKLLMDLAKRLYIVKYQTLRDITLKLRDFDSGISEADALQQFTSFDCLVIDEVGRGKVSAYQSDVLFHIINARYNEMKPTIVISNHTQQQLKTLFGEATLDRLLSGALLLTFNYPSFR